MNPRPIDRKSNALPVAPRRQPGRGTAHVVLPVWVTFGIERGHVADLLEVDVGKDQFVVAGVDDGRPVGTRKHIRRRHRAEHLKNRRLRTKNHLLLVAQHACSVISVDIDRNQKLPTEITPYAWRSTDAKISKLAPCGNNGRLFTTDVSAKF